MSAAGRAWADLWAAEDARRIQRQADREIDNLESQLRVAGAREDLNRIDRKMFVKIVIEDSINLADARAEIEGLRGLLRQHCIRVDERLLEKDRAAARQSVHNHWFAPENAKKLAAFLDH